MNRKKEGEEKEWTVKRVSTSFIARGFLKEVIAERSERQLIISKARKESHHEIHH